MTHAPSSSPSRLPPHAAIAVIEAIRQHFAARLQKGRPALPDAPSEKPPDDPRLAAELEHVLRLLAGVDFSRPDDQHLSASQHPVARLLQNADETGSPVDAVLRAVRPHLTALPWRYSYDDHPDAPGLSQRMGWAELVGPIAPFHSDRVCLGLTAIGPDTLYPAHAHPAVETYLVVSGTAAWTANGVTRRQPPGALILHPAHAVHAMRTDSAPLLAAYAWTGDVHTLSAYVAGDV